MDVNSLGKSDGEDIAWCVIESLASADDNVAAVASVIHLLRSTTS